MDSSTTASDSYPSFPYTTFVMKEPSTKLVDMGSTCPNSAGSLDASMPHGSELTTVATPSSGDPIPRTNYSGTHPKEIALLRVVRFSSSPCSWASRAADLC